MTGWELSAIFASGSSLLGVTLGDRSVFTMRAYVAVALVCIVTLVMLSLRVPLPHLAMLPCLLFATATDLRAEEVPLRTSALAAVGGVVEWTLHPMVSFAILLGSWALLAAALVLALAVSGYLKKAALAVSVIAAFVSLLTYSPIALGLGVVTLCAGLLRADFSETSIGPGDAIPAACLAAALGPFVGLAFTVPFAVALVAVALAKRLVLPLSSHAPVVPAMLAAFFFHTLTMALS